MSRSDNAEADNALAGKPQAVSARPVNWYDLGSIEDIPLRGSRRVVIDDTRIGIFRTAGGDVFALEDRCPHLGGPLSEGIVHDDCVTCPLHNWVIKLSSGEAQGADSGQVKRYPVNTIEGRVELGIEQTAAMASA